MRNWLIAVIFAIVFVLSGSPIQAEWSQTVLVDVEAENSVVAKQNGITEAERKGFSQLLKEVASTLSLPDQATMVETHASACVANFEVNQEKFSGVRYRAKILLHYNPACVEKLLATKGVKATAPQETTEPPLFISVLCPSAEDALNPLAEATLWSNTMEQAASEQGLKVVYPLRDLTDQTLLPTLPSASPTFQTLERILNHYQTDQSYLIRAYWVSSASGERHLEVRPYIVQPFRTEACAAIQEPFNESDEATFKAAALRALTALSSCFPTSSSSVPQATLGEATSLKAQVNFATLSEWIRLQKLLTTAPFIEEVKTISLHHDSAQLLLTLRTSLEDLTQRLAGLGLHVSQNSDQIIDIRASNTLEK